MNSVTTCGDDHGVAGPILDELQCHAPHVMPGAIQDVAGRHEGDNGREEGASHPPPAVAIDIVIECRQLDGMLYLRSWSGSVPMLNVICDAVTVELTPFSMRTT